MSQYLDNAKRLIENSDASSLRHACLELRMAIELHVYKKIEFYSKRHGTKLLYKKWEPNKALKILCQLEPKADKSYSLHIAKETIPNVAGTDFKKLGIHEALSVNWLNKNYNKLGAYLHLSNKDTLENKPDIEFLKATIEKIDIVEKNSLLSNFAKVTDFNCLMCEAKIICCEEILPSDEILCPNNDCKGSYRAEEAGDTWIFKLNGSEFSCPECQFINFYMDHEIQINAKLQCSNCKANYKVVGNTWNIAKIV